MLPQIEKVITLVLGGVRSGKSRYLQALGSTRETVSFIATARPDDEEMSARINRHRADRPTHWNVIEEPLDLARALKTHQAQSEVVLIDCLTLWASNLLIDIPVSEERTKRLGEFYRALDDVSTSVAIVSNEVGSGIVPAFASGRFYGDLLGEINQQVAALATNVILMVAGIPLALKGRLEI